MCFQTDSPGTYEQLPLVEGGQGRSSTEVVVNTCLFVAFLFYGASFVAYFLEYRWLAVAGVVVGMLVLLRGLFAATPEDSE